MTDDYRDICHLAAAMEPDARAVLCSAAVCLSTGGRIVTSATDEEAAVLSALREGGTVHDRCTRVVSAIVATAIGENLGDQSKKHGAAKLHAGKETDR